MSRYIDAEKIKYSYLPLAVMPDVFVTKKEIDEMPSEDVAPIVHAHWEISLAENGWKDTVCSNCGFTINDDIQVLWNTKYCPECGAIMDEETGK